MAKLPEGREPLTTMDSADLVLRMHDKLAAGFTAGDRIEELEAKLERAENLLIDAMVQLENGKIKTRRNSAYLIGKFLAELKGETDD